MSVFIYFKLYNINNLNNIKINYIIKSVFTHYFTSHTHFKSFAFIQMLCINIFNNPIVIFFLFGFLCKF